MSNKYLLEKKWKCKVTGQVCYIFLVYNISILLKDLFEEGKLLFALLKRKRESDSLWSRMQIHVNFKTETQNFKNASGYIPRFFWRYCA